MTTVRHTQVINFTVNASEPKMKQFVLETRGDEKHYLAESLLS